MSKYICTLTLIVLTCQFAFSQAEGRIQVNSLKRSGASIVLEGTISVSKNDVPNTFMIFMVGGEGKAPLRVSDIRNVSGRTLRINNTNESLRTELSVGKGERIAVVYPVLLRGDVNNAGQVLPVIDGEYEDINGVLNILHKGKFEPLTYTEARVTER